jgi:hypothetical protein
MHSRTPTFKSPIGLALARLMLVLVGLVVSVQADAQTIGTPSVEDGTFQAFLQTMIVDDPDLTLEEFHSVVGGTTESPL